MITTKERYLPTRPTPPLKSVTASPLSDEAFGYCEDNQKIDVTTSIHNKNGSAYRGYTNEATKQPTVLRTAQRACARDVTSPEWSGSVDSPAQQNSYSTTSRNPPHLQRQVGYVTDLGTVLTGNQKRNGTVEQCVSSFVSPIFGRQKSIPRQRALVTLTSPQPAQSITHSQKVPSWTPSLADMAPKPPPANSDDRRLFTAAISRSGSVGVAMKQQRKPPIPTVSQLVSDSDYSDARRSGYEDRSILSSRKGTSSLGSQTTTASLSGFNTLSDLSFITNESAPSSVHAAEVFKKRAAVASQIFRENQRKLFSLGENIAVAEDTSSRSPTPRLVPRISQNCRKQNRAVQGNLKTSQKAESTYQEPVSSTSEFTTKYAAGYTNDAKSSYLNRRDVLKQLQEEVRSGLITRTPRTSPPRKLLSSSSSVPIPRFRRISEGGIPHGQQFWSSRYRTTSSRNGCLQTPMSTGWPPRYDSRRLEPDHSKMNKRSAFTEDERFAHTSAVSRRCNASQKGPARAISHLVSQSASIVDLGCFSESPDCEENLSWKEYNGSEKHGCNRQTSNFALNSSFQVKRGSENSTADGHKKEQPTPGPDHQCCGVFWAILLLITGPLENFPHQQINLSTKNGRKHSELSVPTSANRCLPGHFMRTPENRYLWGRVIVWVTLIILLLGGIGGIIAAFVSYLLTEDGSAVYQSTRSGNLRYAQPVPITLSAQSRTFR